ncbi:DEAD/DEAH box helicase [Candidatus Woesearchaeota archaeon]|nr:DEAD/DEAH box helicase [Candidatus Woesearchaeota archaeon]
MQFKNFTLDPFQEEAIKAIESNFSVVVSAPTGSGKTLIADFIIDKHKNDQKRIIYTAPIKALSNQKYHDFSKEYGEEKVGLMTGDIVINPQGKIIIMTTEIYRNMAVSNDPDLQNVAYVIFDEVHYINDVERGYVWEESIIYSTEKSRFLCLSATIPNAQEFSDWISSIKKHTVKTVIATKRNVPLKHLFYDYELGITELEVIRDEIIEEKNFSRSKRRFQGKFPEPNHIELIRELGQEKMPCFFFSFSRKDCQNKARELARRSFFKRDSRIIEQFNQSIKDAPSDVSKLESTRILKETISQGIAFHHAGLLPIVKEAIEALFAKGLIKVLYTTETFAVGINMPAKTVCFNSLRKYDGFNFRNLNTKEYFQIAGRAGRRGIDEIGYVVSMIYRPGFRYQEIKAITTADVDPIKSQFKLSVNTVLNLINLHTPQEIEHILRLSFFSYQKFGKNYWKVPTKLLLARYDNIVKKLMKLGYVVQGELTQKGIFSSKVFADEITMGEIFATELAEELDEYQILLILACLVYESKERNIFKNKVKNEQLKNLINLLHQDQYLWKEQKFRNMQDMTAIIYQVYNGKSFFELLSSTNLLEGDLIRFFSQILDRVGQIKKATTDYRLINKMNNCKGIVERSLEGIYLV